MAAVLHEDVVSDKPESTHPSTATSTVPLLGEGFQETPPVSVAKSTEASDSEEDANDEEAKPGLRRLFGFGKKKDELKGKGKKKIDLEQAGTSAPKESSSPKARVPAALPISSTHPYRAQSPPNRNLHSSSPRMVSPAGSQIFERDVQETSLPVPNSPAIPSHIQTENHIPSVLDASSEAITDENLDPDSVEIVTHSYHHPAVFGSVAALSSSEITGGSWPDELVGHPDKEDSASNYGTLDSSDIRRLSFISFADVVNSEHAEHSGVRESMHIAGLTSLSSGHRSPSPMRSPVSSQGHGTSPPTSKSASIKGLDLSPTRPGKPIGSPTITTSPLASSELNIETMSQALRRTGSGDLSGARSQPMSPVSPDGFSERLHR